MHASAAANGVVVSFPSKMLTHRKIAPAAIKPKLAMMKRVFSIFFIAFFSFFILSRGDVFAVFLQLLLLFMFSLNTIPNVGEGDDFLPKRGFFGLHYLTRVDGMKRDEFSVPVDPRLFEPLLTPVRFTTPNLCSVHKRPSFFPRFGKGQPKPFLYSPLLGEWYECLPQDAPQ